MRLAVCHAPRFLGPTAFLQTGQILKFMMKFRALYRGAKAKFHARRTIWRMNAIVKSGIHNEARRLRVAAAFLAAAESSAAGRLAEAWSPSRPPFAMRCGIPVGRGRNRFSFRRHFPCSLLPRLCARLLSPARHAIHGFRRCEPLCVPIFRCISSPRGMVFLNLNGELAFPPERFGSERVSDF